MQRFANNNEMGMAIGHTLLRQKLTLATAESCTGGTIASMVTAIPGSSTYFKGGVVSYAVSVKEQVLGVTLKEGVVSLDTALQMARGAAKVCGADCGVATTGVAGPGSSNGKDQGTVCVAAVCPSRALEICKEYHFEGEREDVILQAADSALRLLNEILCK